MKKIGIFFGSDTGNTENVAKIIGEHLGNNIIEIYDIARTKKETIEKFNKLILGIPTWYYGEIQCDWDDFLPIIKEIDFKNKKIALFGCGDQEDYSEYFCDAIGIVFKILKEKQANIFGFWPTSGYKFHSSKAVINKNYFAGLAIDEDRQPELTNKRIKIWTQQIKKEFDL
ncbi:flavodoxin FldA [Buchnera aphidicola (Neophyllaphis podocarpi)]|uniref:flavodoxin FldA n=1 Tax=Buchnera aphidicola TaxID=9 RepID=UPI0031B85B01